MVFLKDGSVNIEIIKSKSQDEIIKLAKSDSDWRVRLAAVEYVEDESVLKDVFNNDSINTVCIKAMENIQDADFLSDACMNNPDSYLRLATLNRICDESLMEDNDLSLLLESVALSDPEVLLRKAALEIPNFKNQNVLCDIAKNSSEDDLRRIAVSKIIDEDVLADFALNDSSVFVRREAIQNLNLKNDDILIDVVKSDFDEFNRYWACQKIEDEDFLLKIIYDGSFKSCLSVISQNPNLPKEDYFIDVYENDEDEYHRLAAVNFISDSSFLDSIVLNESDDKIRAAAIKNNSFNNQKILKDLILSDSSLDVLLEVVSKVNDEELLIDFVKNHLDSKELVAQAINNISDISFLEELYANNGSEMRYLIVNRLCEIKSADSSLRSIALKESDKNISIKAIGAISSTNELIKIADESQDKDIKMLSLENIAPKRLLDNYLPKKSIIDKSLDDALYESKLNNIALNEEDVEIRCIAVSKLNDKSILDELASGEGEVSIIAQKRLDTLFEDIKLINQEVILKHLIKSDDVDVSYVAQQQLDDLKTWPDRISKVNEISDIDTLKDIARNDFNYYVRCEAEGKLEKILFNIRLDEIGTDVNQEKLKQIARDVELSDDIRNKARLKIIDD